MHSNLVKQFAVPQLHGRQCKHHPIKARQSRPAMRSDRALDQIVPDVMLLATTLWQRSPATVTVYMHSK